MLLKYAIHFPIYLQYVTVMFVSDDLLDVTFIFYLTFILHSIVWLQKSQE